MSTGVVAPPRDQQEDWWEVELETTTDIEARRPAAKEGVSSGSAVAALEDALDLAIEAGVTDWEKRRAIEALIAHRIYQSPEVTHAEILALLDEWERETGRLGSIHAAKCGHAYSRLLETDSTSVIRVALGRLERQGASPHLLMLLEEIAGAAPAASETTVAGAARAWIDWGRRQGLT